MPAMFTKFLPEAFLLPSENLAFLLRILMAAILGILIGSERTKRLKDAGVRTHCIIAVTAATFMILSKYAFVDIEGVLGAKNADPARLSAQVVSGITFLGAGVIFKDRNSSVKGLTTAAGMWATAAVGMAAGAGMYWLSIIATAIVTFSQMILHRFPVGNDVYHTQELVLRFEENPDTEKKIQELLAMHSGRVEQSDISRHGTILSMKLLVRLKSPITYEESLALLDEHPDIYQVCL